MENPMVIQQQTEASPNAGAFELISAGVSPTVSSRATQGITERALLNHLDLRYGCQAEPLRDHLKAHPLVEIEVSRDTSKGSLWVRWNPSRRVQP